VALEVASQRDNEEMRLSSPPRSSSRGRSTAEGGAAGGGGGGGSGSAGGVRGGSAAAATLPQVVDHLADADAACGGASGTPQAGGSAPEQSGGPVTQPSRNGGLSSSSSSGAAALRAPPAGADTALLDLLVSCLRDFEMRIDERLSSMRSDFEEKLASSSLSPAPSLREKAMLAGDGLLADGVPASSLRVPAHSPFDEAPAGTASGEEEAMLGVPLLSNRTCTPPAVSSEAVPSGERRWEVLAGERRWEDLTRTIEAWMGDVAKTLQQINMRQDLMDAQCTDLRNELQVKFEEKVDCSAWREVNHRLHAAVAATSEAVQQQRKPYNQTLDELRSHAATMELLDFRLGALEEAWKHAWNCYGSVQGRGGFGSTPTAAATHLAAPMGASSDSDVAGTAQRHDPQQPWQSLLASGALTARPQASGALSADGGGDTEAPSSKAPGGPPGGTAIGAESLSAFFELWARGVRAELRCDLAALRKAVERLESRDSAQQARGPGGPLGILPQDPGPFSGCWAHNRPSPKPEDQYLDELAPAQAPMSARGPGDSPAPEPHEQRRAPSEGLPTTTRDSDERDERCRYDGAMETPRTLSPSPDWIAGSPHDGENLDSFPAPTRDDGRRVEALQLLWGGGGGGASGGGGGGGTPRGFAAEDLEQQCVAAAMARAAEVAAAASAASAAAAKPGEELKAEAAAAAEVAFSAASSSTAPSGGQVGTASRGLFAAAASRGVSEL